MSKDIFNDKQKKNMSIDKPAYNVGGFDEAVVNKDLMQFVKAPDTSKVDDSPYKNFETEHGLPNALLSKRGAKLIHNDLKAIKDNQNRENSTKFLNLPDKKMRKVTNDVTYKDFDLNDDLVNDAKQNALVNNDNFTNLDKNTTLFDGKSNELTDGDTIKGLNYYQIEHNPDDIEGAGDINQDESLDDSSLNLEYSSDQRDQNKTIMNNPKDVNYFITNYTNPIFNNEEIEKDAQTGMPYLIGRETTKNTAGVYVSCANTPQNREKISKVLKEYSPKYSKLYEKNIKPYAQELSHNRTISRSHSNTKFHTFNKAVIDKQAMKNDKNVKLSRINNHKLSPKQVLALKKRQNHTRK